MNGVLTWLVLPLIARIVTLAHVAAWFDALLGLLERRAARLPTPLGIEVLAELRAFVARPDVAGWLAAALDHLIRGRSSAAVPTPAFDPAQPPAADAPPAAGVGPVRRAARLLARLW